MIERWISLPLYTLLYSIRVRHGSDDKLCWIPSRGLFDVRSYYNGLVPCDNTSFLWSIWQNKAPLRVVFFAWSTALGKILTMDNLKEMTYHCGSIVLHV